MFVKHKGDSILEWVVLAVLVIAILGVSAFGLANASNTRGTQVTNWVTNLPALP